MLLFIHYGLITKINFKSNNKLLLTSFNINVIINPTYNKKTCLHSIHILCPSNPSYKWHVRLLTFPYNQINKSLVLQKLQDIAQFEVMIKNNKY